MSDKGPHWNSYNVELPSYIWLDPLGVEENDFKNGSPIQGVIVSKNKDVSFNCKFVPYQKLLDAENQIKKLKKQLGIFRND